MLSKEQRATLQQSLAQPFGYANLTLDGHEINIRRCHIKENRSALVVFVNRALDTCAFRSVAEAPDIYRKVWRLRSAAVYSAKDVKAIEKVYGKRRARKEYPRLHDRHQYLDPSFNTAASLVRQLAKLEGLELVKMAEVHT